VRLVNNRNVSKWFEKIYSILRISLLHGCPFDTELIDRVHDVDHSHNIYIFCFLFALDYIIYGHLELFSLQFFYCFNSNFRGLLSSHDR
jgi:hypothetical protein